MPNMLSGTLLTEKFSFTGNCAGKVVSIPKQIFLFYEISVFKARDFSLGSVMS